MTAKHLEARMTLFSREASGTSPFPCWLVTKYANQRCTNLSAPMVANEPGLKYVQAASAVSHYANMIYTKLPNAAAGGYDREELGQIINDARETLLLLMPSVKLLSTFGGPAIRYEVWPLDPSLGPKAITLIDLQGSWVPASLSKVFATMVETMWSTFHQLDGLDMLAVAGTSAADLGAGLHKAFCALKGKLCGF